MFKTLATLINGQNARAEDRISRLEFARNEKLLSGYVSDDKI